ncbi:MAG: hypothetical protein AAGI91_14480 [Bacteroidota bacterium]
MIHASLSPVRLARPEAASGDYAPSPRLRQALRHLHSDLRDRTPESVARAASPQPARPGEGSTEAPRVLLYSTAPTLRLYLCACLSASYALDDTADVLHHTSQPTFSRPDLMITDLVTLERTRFALLELREPGGPLAGIPFLLLSQEPGTRLRCGPAARPDRVLSIPVMPDALRSIVQALASPTHTGQP